MFIIFRILINLLIISLHLPYKKLLKVSQLNANMVTEKIRVGI